MSTIQGTRRIVGPNVETDYWLFNLMAWLDKLPCNPIRTIAGLWDRWILLYIVMSLICFALINMLVYVDMSFTKQDHVSCSHDQLNIKDRKALSLCVCNQNVQNFFKGRTRFHFENDVAIKRSSKIVQTVCLWDPGPLWQTWIKKTLKSNRCLLTTCTWDPHSTVIVKFM